MVVVDVRGLIKILIKIPYSLSLSPPSALPDTNGPQTQHRSERFFPSWRMTHDIVKVIKILLFELFLQVCFYDIFDDNGLNRALRIFSLVHYYYNY